jgi:peptidoglycan/xylan/chitin deacetylase (PgdA/CDA1 family)
MPRPRIIEWPNKAKICVTFIIPWEVWPENFATSESLQRHGGATLPPSKAVFKQNMALVTEREYGDRVGIWRIMDMFSRHNLKVTFLMNGLKVEQFPEECKEFKAQGHGFPPRATSMSIPLYTASRNGINPEDRCAFEKVLGRNRQVTSPGHADANTLELVAEAALSGGLILQLGQSIHSNPGEKSCCGALQRSGV